MVSGIETLIISLRDAGFPLILLWLLTLSIVYGLLSHANIPKSLTTRGLISLTAAFLVLLTAAASPAVAFMQNLLTASIVLAFTILLAVIFLEMGGVKQEGKHIISAYPKFFGAIILVIFVGVFMGAGGMKILGISAFSTGKGLSTGVISIGLFLIIIAAAVWLLYKETSGDKK